ncbi:hypothetical protein [Nocardia africana]|uniref:Uncharacterized protein n=1 Tax=Nocardia africana TaxID=134964 RepID=A0ABW6NVX3_9NOCA
MGFSTRPAVLSTALLVATASITAATTTAAPQTGGHNISSGRRRDR